MTPPPSAARPRLGRPAVALLILLVIAALTGTLAPRSEASATQVSIMQDDPQLLANPAATLLRFRQLGAQQARVAIRWQAIAPNPNSFTAPAHFNGSNPASYATVSWEPYDAIVRAAAADGIQVNFNVVGGAPLWATGPQMPRIKGYPFHNWAPSAAAYGQFVRAIGTRYSGDYDPVTRKIAPGDPNDLPRVSFWSIWNEPDYGPSLAPQALPGHPGVPYSPDLYRQLVGQAWSALQATGHGRDSVLIGELAPRATSAPFGDFNGMLPLTFVQSLYCLGANYQPLTGSAAQLQGCPTTAAGVAHFVAQNPALFQMTGFSDHAYMRWFPPDQEQNFQSNVLKPYPSQTWASLVKGFTSLATIGNLQGALNRIASTYKVKRTFPIWNTEFGYITNPPKKIWAGNAIPYVSPATAADYDNWAEYLSWKNPQIASFEQYLLYDAEPATQADNYGGFASGLLAFGGRQKADYPAWRLPLYMPQTTASGPNQSLLVWGEVRPVDYALLDEPLVPEAAQLLFEPGGKGRYILLGTVKLTNPSGYFTQQIRFPSSGTLVLRWYYPIDAAFGSASGAAVFSRGIQVTVK
jgi:hypothetical protein